MWGCRTSRRPPARPAARLPPRLPRTSRLSPPRSNSSGDGEASRAYGGPVTILLDPAYVVPPAPAAGPVGTLAWLRASVPRFCEGAEHARRRALLQRRLARVSPESLRRPGDHVAVLAEALGAS